MKVFSVFSFCIVAVSIGVNIFFSHKEAMVTASISIVLCILIWIIFFRKKTYIRIEDKQNLGGQYRIDGSSHPAGWILIAWHMPKDLVHVTSVAIKASDENGTWQDKIRVTNRSERSAIAFLFKTAEDAKAARANLTLDNSETKTKHKSFGDIRGKFNKYLLAETIEFRIDTNSQH